LCCAPTVQVRHRAGGLAWGRGGFSTDASVEWKGSSQGWEAMGSSHGHDRLRMGLPVFQLHGVGLTEASHCLVCFPSIMLTSSTHSCVVAQLFTVCIRNTNQSRILIGPCGINVPTTSLNKCIFNVPCRWVAGSFVIVVHATTGMPISMHAC